MNFAFYLLALLPQVIAAKVNPMCQVHNDQGLVNIVSELGQLTTARCIINEYDGLSDNFKKAVSLELKPKDKGGIAFGDDYIWGPEPSDWFARVIKIESFHRLYSNSSIEEVPPGVAKYHFTTPFDDVPTKKLETRAILERRDRQCENDQSNCCCICSKHEGDDKPRTQHCAAAYGGTPKRCGCGNGKNCIQGVTEDNTYNVARCSTSSPVDACFQCHGRKECSC